MSEANFPPVPPTAAPQRSFIVRCWFTDAAQTRRHFVAQDVATGKQRYFAELDFLLDFLAQELVGGNYALNLENESN